MSWTKTEPGHALFEGAGGTATVTLVGDRWRWEASSVRGMFDMDGWWGFASTEVEAREAAERYLR